MRLAHGLCIAMLVLLPACAAAESPTPSHLPGIRSPLRIQGVTLSVERAQVERSYSVHYIMKYPEPAYAFCILTLSIAGLEEPVEWGRANLALRSGSEVYELELARPVLVGNDIQYRAEEELEYVYEFIYRVPRNADFNNLRLSVAGLDSLELNRILERHLSDETPSLAQVFSESATIGGGEGNQAPGPWSTVGGGLENTARAAHATVSGGKQNSAMTASSVISGGQGNLADGPFSAIAGGYANSIMGRNGFIGGGSRNQVSAHYATVAGGIQNQITHSSATISGGAYNKAQEVFATIGGGTRNEALGFSSVVGGGSGNLSEGSHSSVGGGLGNAASGDYATIAGGSRNLSAGSFASVLGGFENRADGDYSLAGGFGAIVAEEHPGSIVLADASGLPFHSSATNEFAVRATGGVRLVTAVGRDSSPASGVVLEPGSGSWSSLSDRALKRDVQAVDSMAVLDVLMELPVSTWSYSSQHPDIRHIGPVAQDFYQAFGYGESETQISTVDADGVSLAAIQGLALHLQERDQIIADQSARLSHLESRLEKLEFEAIALKVLVLAAITCGSFIAVTNKSLLIKGGPR